jgi:uncharacterized protein YheU (UPF0270 family)
LKNSQLTCGDVTIIWETVHQCAETEKIDSPAIGFAFQGF